jgi:Kef-type K+ transport system membrane component KefB
MEPLTEQTLARLLLQIVILLLVSRALGEAMKRLGQPPVIGELAGGILLGPTLLARFLPEVHQWLFPARSLQQTLLETVAFLGLLFLLLMSGIEIDTRVLRQLGRPTAFITVADFIFPFALGAWAGWFAPEAFIGSQGSRIILMLFLGTGLAITALPVIAKILIDLNAIRRNVGVAIMGAAMTEDLVGWTLLFVIIKLAHEGGLRWATLAEIGLGVGAFLAVAYFWGRPLLRFLLRWVAQHVRLEYATLTAVALFTFTYAAITQALGIHAVFGAFLAGVTVARSPELRPQSRETIREFSLGILTPIFFCIVGLQVDFVAVQNWLFFWLFLLFAVTGKIVGSLLGGSLGGLRWRESLAIGVGMNARGAMELVLAVVGFSQGLISRELFSIIVLLAMTTSLMTPPLMRLCLRGLPFSPEETARMQRTSLATDESP